MWFNNKTETIIAVDVLHNSGSINRILVKKIEKIVLFWKIYYLKSLLLLLFVVKLEFNIPNGRAKVTVFPLGRRAHGEIPSPPNLVTHVWATKRIFNHHSLISIMLSLIFFIFLGMNFPIVSWCYMMISFGWRSENSFVSIFCSENHDRSTEDSHQACLQWQEVSIYAARRFALRRPIEKGLHDDER